MYFCDFRFQETVTIDRIYKMPEEIARVPFYSFRCILQDFEEFESSKSRSNTYIDKLDWRAGNVVNKIHLLCGPFVCVT